MKISVILYSTLREKLPPENNGRVELELSDGCTISDVVKQLNLSGTFLCAVNKVIERNREALIQDGDELRFFRPGSGGNTNQFSSDCINTLQKTRDSI